MIIKESIKTLENLYNSPYNKDLEKKSVSLICNIFNHIKKKNDNYFNIFIDELQKNFIIYFINVLKSKKRKSILSHNNKISKHKYVINNIDQNLIGKIKKILKNEIVKLFENEKKNKISRLDLSYSGGIKIRKVIRILNNFLGQNGHLEMVSNYLGFKSSISGLALELSSIKSNWWKHKKKNLEPKTLAVHLDKELTSIKSIIYLTDVRKGNGPFTVYPKIYDDLKLNIFQDILGRIILETATNIKNEKLKKYLDIKENSQPFLSANLQKIYLKLPEIISFNSHFGWELESGSELEKKIIDNKIEIYGNSGTMITFDGSKLLHSGGLIKESNRLALQVIYSKKINLFSKFFKKIKNKFN